MKHAGPAALDALEDVLAQVRLVPGLKERSRGIFYRRSKAFLHFHEDPAGPFADLSDERAWTRFRVATRAERRTLVAAVRRAAPLDH